MNQDQRIALSKKSLLGVSIGDAFGDSFFGDHDKIMNCISNRIIPKTKWEFTDDTVMAIAVFEQMEKHGKIVQDELAQCFSANHDKDVRRGYGATARRILREIGEGGDWKAISSSVFSGMGSMGNGASMRVSPIGAYLFDNVEQLKIEAEKSAEITHANIEAITGAIAVALATSLATKMGLTGQKIAPNDFLEAVIKDLPESDTKSKIKKALSVPYSYNIETVKTILGNGSQIITQDTVPFSIWCAAHNLSNYEEAIWKAVSILGDRDTICAIVGGIVIMSSPEETIPKNWVASVEDVEKSVFRNSPTT